MSREQQKIIDALSSFVVVVVQFSFNNLRLPTHTHTHTHKEDTNAPRSVAQLSCPLSIPPPTRLLFFISIDCPATG